MMHSENHKTPWRALAAMLALLLALSGCVAGDTDTVRAADAQLSESAASGEETAPTAPDAANAPTGMPGMGTAGVTTQAAPLAAELSDRDKSGEYDAATAVSIALSGDTATIDGAGASIEGGVLTVSEAGTYVLTGALSGQILIEATSEDKIQLVLSNASVTCADGPALLIMQADKVFLTLPAGTASTLTDGSAYAEAYGESKADACVFSKDDLTVNGTGSLTVAGNYKHGIATKDDLVLYDAALTVTAVETGVKANNSISVGGGANASITAGQDGCNTEGDFIMEGGALTISAGDDGVHADYNLTVNGGTVNVGQSEEGFEALAICITGGTVDIVSNDDGVNATSSAETADATGSEPAAEQPALDAALGAQETPAAEQDVSAGDAFGQGFPGKGGGFGGRGGGTFEVVEGAIIAILGGELSVTAGGDGLDSNGDLLISGGTTIVASTGQGDSALDYNGGSEISGGTLVAAGAAGMAQAIYGSESVPVLTATADEGIPAGTELTLLDAQGKALVACTIPAAWQNVVLHAPDMAVGGTYTLQAGTVEICTATLEGAQTSYGSAGMQFGGPGGRGHDAAMPEGMQPPEGMEPPVGGMGGRGGGRRGGAETAQDATASASPAQES